MRIISGKNKGRKIIAPDSLPVRPTTDYAKESLFNILNNEYDFTELNVLDLFAGTGNISFEFASRGSKLVQAIDKNKACISFIKQTAKKLNFTSLIADVSDYRAYINYSYQSFDIIFADPPYGMDSTTDLPDIIFEKKILTEEGLFILEHDRRLDFSVHSFFYQHRKYGKVNFSFFKNQKS